MNPLEPFLLPFLREAMVVAALTGLVCAVLSCFLILRGWSLMGDAISHAVLPGIVLAYLSGIPLAFGAFAAGLFCASATGFIKERCRVKEDTVLGVVFTGMFALGLVLFTKVETDQHLNHILMGNLLGVVPSDLRRGAAVAGITLLCLLLFRRHFALLCFDPAHARAIGVRVGLWNQFLLALLAMTVVASLQVVGLILVVAMLVAPGATARLCVARLGPMMLVASATAVFSAVAGTYASYYLNGATGACIVLVQSLVFLLVFLLAPARGVLVRRRGG